MRIAITGSHGLIGSALVASLQDGEHEVVRVVRSRPRPREIGWDPARGELDPDALRGLDAVVHLAGEPVAARRWSAEQKRRILDSRAQGTSLIARAIAGLDGGPSVLVSASGINYYGDRGDEALTEDSGSGSGFLAEVCRAWEGATAPAEEAGVRVVHLRTGIVQSANGGALARLLPLFKLGLGGRLGSGRQYMSWIAIDDVVGLYEHALSTAEVAGPLNAVAPNPVTNAEYTRVLASVLGRPALLPVPKFGPRLVFGEMADELLFASMRVLPERALATGYTFRHTNLEDALRAVLGRQAG